MHRALRHALLLQGHGNRSHMRLRTRSIIHYYCRKLQIRDAHEDGSIATDKDLHYGVYGLGQNPSQEWIEPTPVPPCPERNKMTESEGTSSMFSWWLVA
ncbi:unnamed protein product [Urochloa humidicola]